MPNYLVYTTEFGVIRKTDDCIADARAWARQAFPRDRQITVVREVAAPGEKIPTGSLLRQFQGGR